MRSSLKPSDFEPFDYFKNESFDDLTVKLNKAKERLAKVELDPKAVKERKECLGEINKLISTLNYREKPERIVHVDPCDECVKAIDSTCEEYNGIVVCKTPMSVQVFTSENGVDLYSVEGDKNSIRVKLCRPNCLEKSKDLLDLGDYISIDWRCRHQFDEDED
jgi:hypothetical protein